MIPLYFIRGTSILFVFVLLCRNINSTWYMFTSLYMYNPDQCSCILGGNGFLWARVGHQIVCLREYYPYWVGSRRGFNHMAGCTYYATGFPGIVWSNVGRHILQSQVLEGPKFEWIFIIFLNIWIN